MALIINISSINKINSGFAATNNVGFSYAVENNFDYVYLLNQDTVVEKDFLAEALAVAESDSAIGAVQSKLLLYSDKGKINSIGNEIHYLGFAFAGGYKTPDRPMPEKEITYPSGAAVLIKVSALKQTGFFNPEFFMYHEDTDLGWRLWLCGYKIILAPRSVVYHKYEFSRSIKKYYYMERNRLIVILQNYKLATLLLIGPAGLLMGTLMFFYSFIAGWWRQYIAVLAYFCHYQHWQMILSNRKTVQQKRTIKDRLIIKRFVGKIEFQEINNPLLRYIVNPFFNLYWQLIKRLICW